jgi:hypothetical protein
LANEATSALAGPSRRSAKILISVPAMRQLQKDTAPVTLGPWTENAVAIVLRKKRQGRR